MKYSAFHAVTKETKVKVKKKLIQYYFIREVAMMYSTQKLCKQTSTRENNYVWGGGQRVALNIGFY